MGEASSQADRVKPNRGTIRQGIDRGFSLRGHISHTGRRPNTGMEPTRAAFSGYSLSIVIVGQRRPPTPRAAHADAAGR